MVLPFILWEGQTAAVAGTVDLAEFDGKSLDYDVVLTSGGTRLGLMLGRNVEQLGQMGKKNWTLEEVPTPTNLRVGEDGAGLVDLPPEMESVVFRDRHTEGMGSLQIGTVGKEFYTGSGQAFDGGFVVPPSADELDLPTSEGDVRVWFEFGSALYVSDGRYLHKTANGANFVQVLDAGEGNAITHGLPFGADDGDTGVVVAAETTSTGAAIDYFFSTDGAAFTQVTTDATRRPHYFVQQDQTLFGLLNPNELRTTTDPFEAAAVWAGPTIIGDEANDFHGGVVVAGVILLFKEDRVYTLDVNADVATLIAQFANTPGPLNFPDHAVGFNSNVYTIVDNEVWEYDPVSGNLAALGLSTLSDTEYDPDYTRGITYDGRALFTIRQSRFPGDITADTTLMRTTFDGARPVFQQWVEQTISGYRPEGPVHFSRLFPTLKTGRGVYFATDTAGKVGRLNVPRTENPTADEKTEYTTVASRFLSGWMVHNFPGQTKDYTEVTLDLQGLSPAPPKSTADVYFYTDFDLSSRTLLKANLDANKLHTLEFSSGLSARSFMLEVILTSDDPSSSPNLLSWSVRASVKFRLREVLGLVVRLEDHVQGRFGTISPFSVRQLRDLLRTFRKSLNNVISYQDYRGYQFDNVRILPGFQEVEAEDEAAGVDKTLMALRIMRVSEATPGAFIVGSSVVDGPDVIGSS